MSIPDDELDRRLAALADPTPLIDPAAARALVREAAAPSRRRGRKRAWMIAGALALTGALAVPTTAVAIRLFEAQTGRVGAPGMTEELAGDEWIDLGAEDLDGYIASVAPRELPVPESFDWESTIVAVAGQFERSFGGENAEMQRIGIVSVYEREIWLAWLREWIEADRAGDDARRDAALAVLAEAPDWSTFVATDGGGIRFVMWSYVARIASDDPAVRHDAAQALLQQEVVDPLVWLEENPIDAMTGERIDVDEVIAGLSPTQAALRELWDGRDRTAVNDEIHAGIAEISDETDTTPGSQWWRDHERALREIAAAAGHPDPLPSVRLDPAAGGEG